MLTKSEIRSSRSRFKHGSESNMTTSFGDIMSEMETFHDSQAERDSEEEEVIFREDNPRRESPTPPSMVVTANDLDIIIEGWERKFEHLSQCMQEIQLASKKANSNMN